MWRKSGFVINGVIVLSQWLMALFMLGLLVALILIIYRFFADLFSLGLRLKDLHTHDMIVGDLNLIDVVLVANLILIVIFAGFANYIRHIRPADDQAWPPGLKNLGFGAVKMRLLGSIAGIAIVDALAWYFDLETQADASKLIWVVAFPLMFVVVMLLMAIADWFERQSAEHSE